MSSIPIPKPPLAIEGDLTNVITDISNGLIVLVGVVAVLFVIVGGFQYITSAGNPENINKAKHTILYTIIGVIVTMLAYAAVNYVITNLIVKPN